MTAIDVVALGEILIDVVATRSGVSLFHAPAFEPKAGGAPANVAVGVRRLGKSAAFVGKVGRDDFGAGLRETLAEAGVETRALLDDRHLPTTLALVALAEGGDPHFAFYPGAHTNLTPEDLDLDLIRSARVFHCGSVSLAHEPVRGATLAGLRAAHAAGVICSYDVNWRPALWDDAAAGVALARQPLELADIVKMSAGELRLLSGEEDLERALLGFASPAALVMVTLGGEGCVYRFGGKLHRQAAAPVRAVVDATGAGDSFLATLLASLPAHPRDLDEATLAAMTRRAAQAAAITVTRRGAIPALPTAAEVDAALAAGATAESPASDVASAAGGHEPVPVLASAADRREARQRFFREGMAMWTTGDLSAFDAFVAPEYVGHVAAGDRDREGLKQRIREFHAQYPDARFVVEDQWAEGDKVVTRMTLRMTDPERGEPVTRMGINITRFAGERMAEEWNTWETLRG